jgi:cytochrome c553
MKLYIFLFCLYLFCFAEDTLFITDYEYGQMLYKNPRGIGCIKCHGKKGKRTFIAKYIHKNKTYQIFAPDIYNLSLEKFKQKLQGNRNVKSIMPTYFLTNDEIKSIYQYITNKK